jgi:glyoxalase-like protein
VNIALVDHLVYAGPDLEAAIEDLNLRLGVRAAPGGRHPGEGTRNSLIALGRDIYLEVLGPDPGQGSPGKPRWFGIDVLRAPRLAGWAAKAGDLEDVARRAVEAGIPLGPVIAGSRNLSDRVSLQWRFTDPHAVVGDGIVPFFIDWTDSPHPSRAAARGASLIALRAEHPEPERVREMLAGLAVDLQVEAGAQPALIASLRTPRGLVDLS